METRIKMMTCEDKTQNCTRFTLYFVKGEGETASKACCKHNHQEQLCRYTTHIKARKGTRHTKWQRSCHSKNN